MEQGGFSLSNHQGIKKGQGFLWIGGGMCSARDVPCSWKRIAGGLKQCRDVFGPATHERPGDDVGGKGGEEITCIFGSEMSWKG